MTVAVPMHARTAATSGICQPVKARGRAHQAARASGSSPARTSAPRQLEVLAQVQPGPQLVDCPMPVCDHLDTGRLEQPRGQDRLARSRAGGAKSFKHRPAAEEVEVGGIWVIEVQVFESGDSRPRPSALNPGQSPRIEIDRPPRTVRRPA